jgi:RNA polymerase sigma-70 factor (ECF subfamily)
MTVIKTETSKEGLLEKVKNGDEVVLQKLYGQFRDKFLIWSMNNHNISEDDAADVYQKAFTILYYNAKDGKLNELTSSLETYLFGIGKMVVKELFRDKHFGLQSLEQKEAMHQIDPNIMSGYENNELKEMMKELLGKLGDPCKSVLVLYYFKKYAMESIAIELGYKDERVARKKKFQCLEKLRGLYAESQYN